MKRLIQALINFLEENHCHCRLLLVGDLQQIPPIVNERSQDATYDASFASSPEFCEANQILLTVQHRQSADPAWGDFSKSIGLGKAAGIRDHPYQDADRSSTAVPAPLIDNLFCEVCSVLYVIPAPLHVL